LAGRGHAPNRISNVISNQKRARLVEREADGSSTRSSFRVKEIGDDILGFPIGVTAAERHEDDFEAIESRTVPTSVFADERAAAIFLRQTVGGIKNESERGNVRTQRIIGNNRFLDQIRALRLDARIKVLAVVTVGPAIEAAGIVDVPNSCQTALSSSVPTQAT
jgi:hypothetical protein